MSTPMSARAGSDAGSRAGSGASSRAGSAAGSSPGPWTSPPAGPPTARPPARRPTPAGPALYAHRRPPGPSFGPLPLACVVVVELGLAAAVVLVALDRALLPLAGVVLSVALLLGLLRRRGRWLVTWLSLAVRYRLRVRERTPERADAGDDPRLRLLRLVVGDLSVARRRDHDGREVGLVGHEGAWSAVLTVDPAEAGTDSLLTDAGPETADASFPLAALAGCLSDRGVVLDAVTALWHCRPGGGDLPADSPAARAYREVLGPLPSVARRSAWLVVRLDPARCPDAVVERGGGVVGAHRALLGALARIRRVLADHDLPMRALDPDEVLRVATTAADLTVGGDPHLVEHWTAAVVGDVGHASFAVTSWPTDATPPTLAALTGVGATSSTLALTVEPGGDDGDVGLRGTVRLAAHTPEQLEVAGRELLELGEDLGLRLDALDGQHAAGIAATLPLGTAP